IGHPVHAKETTPGADPERSADDQESLRGAEPALSAKGFREAVGVLAPVLESKGRPLSGDAVSKKEQTDAPAMQESRCPAFLFSCPPTCRGCHSGTEQRSGPDSPANPGTREHLHDSNLSPIAIGNRASSDGNFRVGFAKVSHRVSHRRDDGSN